VNVTVVKSNLPVYYKILYYILHIPELSKMSLDIRRIQLLNDMQAYNDIRFWGMT
jgi:hypothetical protein